MKTIRKINETHVINNVCWRETKLPIFCSQQVGCWPRTRTPRVRTTMCLFFYIFFKSEIAYIILEFARCQIFGGFWLKRRWKAPLAYRRLGETSRLVLAGMAFFYCRWAKSLSLIHLFDVSWHLNSCELPWAGENTAVWRWQSFWSPAWRGNYII